MAKQFWPKGDELGALITIGKGVGPQFTDPPRQVVGVVGDTRDGGLNSQPFPEMFIPITQTPEGMNALENSISPLIWLVRTRTDPFSLSTDVQSQLRDASGGLPVGDIRLMDQVVQAVHRARQLQYDFAHDFRRRSPCCSPRSASTA